VVLKILSLDDHTLVAAQLADQLRARWANVEVCFARLEDRQACLAASSDADLLLVDCCESGAGGLEVVRAIRQISDVPMVALVAKGDVLQEVRALEGGADDCVASTLDTTCVMARIKRILLRAKLPGPVDASPNLIIGDLQIRFADRAVLRAGQPVPLTPLEYSLLYQLVTHPGRVMPNEALLDRVWGWEREHSPDYVRTFIVRLRAKLETPEGPRYIRTVHRRGYRFVSDDNSHVAEAQPERLHAS
jgi:DNA-binding response OmpR family regulator